jgi:hypothetical protein
MADHQEQLAARWSELVQLIADEFWGRRQDPNAVFSDQFSSRKLKAVLKPNEAGGETFAVTVSEADLLNGDLRDLARRFVDAYRQAAGIGS